MRLTFITLLFCFATLGTSAQTYYYKLNALVKSDGTRVQGNDSGLFVTFTANGCYDSDRKGNTMNNGYQSLQNQYDDRISYTGSSYWGEANYIFASDYSILNIRVGNEVYIYRKSYAHENQTESTYFGTREEKSSTKSAFPIPIYNGNDTHYGENSITDKSQKGSNSRHGRQECPSCHTTKKCNACGGKGWYKNQYADGTPMECSICHRSGSCQTCHGKGWIYF